MTASKKRDNGGTGPALDIVSQSFNRRPDAISCHCCVVTSFSVTSSGDSCLSIEPRAVALLITRLPDDLVGFAKINPNTIARKRKKETRNSVDRYGRNSFAQWLSRDDVIENLNHTVEKASRIIIQA